MNWEVIDMTSAASFFSISTAVVREDFRRYRAVPLLGLAAYLLSTVVPLLVLRSQASTSDRALFDCYSYASSTLNNANPLVLVTTMWVPLLSAVMIYRYLHRQSSMVEVHSQPFTRGQLYRSHLLSSVLFCVLPILFCGLVMLLLSGAVSIPESSDGFFTEELARQMGLADSDFPGSIHLFRKTEVAQWMFDSVVQSVFALSISILAAFVTGTTVHHLIAAAGFNVLMPSMYVFTMIYMNRYLFGFSLEQDRNLYLLSPFLETIMEKHLTLTEAAGYLLVSVVILAAGYGLYRILRLERVSDGVVFGFIRILIELLWGFIGMTVLGYAAYFVFDRNAGLQIVGYVAGALIGIILVRIIVMKTFRIFDKKFFKLLGVYAAAACVFFLVIVPDLPGVEKRIPSIRQIDCAAVDGDTSEVQFWNTGFQMMQEEESLQFIRELHQEIIDHKDEFMKLENTYDHSVVRLYFDYYKNGKDSDQKKLIEHREYAVPVKFLYESDAYRNLKGCSEFKDKKMTFMDFLRDNMTEASITAGNALPETEFSKSYDLSGEEAGELIDCIKQDIRSADTDRLMESMLGNKVAFLNICYPETDPFRRTAYSTSRYFSITPEYEASIRWLREKGYLDEMENNALSACSFAAVTRIGKNANAFSVPKYVEKMIRAEEDEQTRIYSDPEQIRQLYEHYRTNLPKGQTPADYAGSDEYYYAAFCTRDAGSEETGYFYTCGFIKADQIP